MLIKYLAGETLEAETAQVEKNIQEDEAYRQYFEQVKTIWAKSMALATVQPPDESEAWGRFKSRIAYHEQYKQQQSKTKGRWLGLAASVLIILATSVVFFIISTKQKPAREIVFQSLQQVLSDTLPDASVVTLNRNSIITYPQKFKGATRAVSLQGEAFFNVAPNKEKPFVIAVNNVAVKVTGTSFNIKSNNGNTEVVVETGTVEVTANGQFIILGAGEKISVTKDRDGLVKEKVQDRLYNYYRTKEFVCDETPLWKLVEVLNEAYNTRIIIGNNRIKNLPITTVFVNESLPQVLSIISQTLNVTVVYKNNQTILQ